MKVTRPHQQPERKDTESGDSVVHDPIALGWRIRRLRRRSALTQEELADGVITAGYLSRVEAGQRVPSHRVLSALAQRLGVPLSDLLTDSASDRDDWWKIRILRAEAALATGHLEEAAELARECLAAALESQDRAPADAARVVVARTLRTQGRAREALNLLTPVVRDGGPGESSSALSICARCHLELGEVEDAIACARQALMGLDPTVPTETVEAVGVLVQALTRAGQPAEAAEACRQLVRAAASPILGTDMISAYSAAMDASLRKGDLTKAAHRAQQTSLVLDLVRYRDAIASVHEQLAILDRSAHPNPPEPGQAEAALWSHEGTAQ